MSGYWIAITCLAVLAATGVAAIAADTLLLRTLQRRHSHHVPEAGDNTDEGWWHPALDDLDFETATSRRLTRRRR